MEPTKYKAERYHGESWAVYASNSVGGWLVACMIPTEETARIIAAALNQNSWSADAWEVGHVHVLYRKMQ